MKFKVYQITLTREIVEAVNSGKTVPSYKAKMAMNMDFRGEKIGENASKAFDNGYYTHVCNIEAKDFNDVFHVGNVGPETSIERLNRMSSISVGDVIVDETGSMVVVANFGFVAFGHKPALAA
jgi:hypothetical protein